MEGMIPLRIDLVLTVRRTEEDRQTDRQTKVLITALGAPVLFMCRSLYAAIQCQCLAERCAGFQSDLLAGRQMEQLMLAVLGDETCASLAH